MKRVVLILALMVSSLFLTAQAFADSSYTTPGTYTYTVPAGVTSITVKAYGAGGSGDYPGAYGYGGAGGNGGNYAQSTFTVNPGDTYTVIVGAGGGPVGNANHGSGFYCGSPGNTSSFSGLAGNVVAEGGAACYNPQPTSGSIGQIVFAGGLGAQSLCCDPIGGAGGGASGNYLGAGANGTHNGGSAGSPGGVGVNGGGSGGTGGTADDVTPYAQAGGFPGGGGGGAGSYAYPNDSSGAGASGEVIVQDGVIVQSCTNCPQYVEYTGASGGGSAAAMAPLAPAASPSQVFLDPGDVFKLNTAKTGYDYQTGDQLLASNGGPGWCGSAGGGYWCGVTPLQIIPAPVNSFRQKSLEQPPKCSIEAGTNIVMFFPLVPKTIGSATVECDREMSEMQADIELQQLKSGVYVTVSVNVFPDNLYFDTDTAFPETTLNCVATGGKTKGSFSFQNRVTFSAADDEGHITYFMPSFSTIFSQSASKKNPVCAT